MDPIRVVLLGPQRSNPTVAEHIRTLGLAGPIAAVTAGWQEREGEDDELREHLGADMVELALHRRAEEAFAEDPELAEAYRARQDELRALQELYRPRLDDYLASARRLLATKRGPARWLAAERRAALAVVRALDRKHLHRVAAVHRRFETGWRPFERPAIARHRREIARLLEKASGLAVAGGHVAVLLNRLRLFGVDRLLGTLPVIAWSAGAMVMTERVVLFHDTPPQGAGNAEVLESGLGLVPGVVALPQARKRLLLDQPIRVALFARRFHPAACLPLDERSSFMWDGQRWQPGPGAQRLTPSGGVARWTDEEARA